MPPEMLGILTTMGLPGVVIFGLGWAVIKLYNRVQELQTLLADLGKEAVLANEKQTNALNQMAEVNRATGTTLQQVFSMVQQLLWSSGHRSNAGE